MKIRIYILLALFGLCTHFSNAQVAKGNILLGGTAAFSFRTFDNNAGDLFSFALNPQAGVFLTDRFALGGNIGINYGSTNLFNSTSITIGANGRYYINANSEQWWPFANAGAGYGYSNFNSNDLDNFNSDVFSYFFGIGLDYFITNSVALEGTFNFQGTRTDSGFENAPTIENNDLLFSVGLQIFFNRNVEEE